MNLDRAPFVLGLRRRFVVPALAGPGLPLRSLLTSKSGPAKAGLLILSGFLDLDHALALNLQPMSYTGQWNWLALS